MSSIQPVSHILSNSAHIDVVFLPYYLFMHIWLGLSQSLWWMRLPSLVAGAAAVAALALLARRWLPLGLSVLAGFLLALNPLFSSLTIEARPYAPAALFAVLSTAALVSAIDRGGRHRWVLYGLASLCMLLLHLLAVFVLAAHLAGVVIARRRSALAPMVAALGSVAVAVSPLVVKATGQTWEASWIPRSTLGTFHAALKGVSGGRIEAVALVICGIIVIAALASAPRGSDRAFGLGLSLAWGAVPILLLVLVSFLHSLYVTRYAVGCLPGIALTEALAGWRAWTFITAERRARQTSAPGTQATAAPGTVHRHNRQLAFVTATITCGAAGIVGLALLADTVHMLQPGRNDFRSAAAALRRDLQERPAPFAVIPNGLGVGVSYYATPPTLARALRGQAIRADTQHTLTWNGGPAALQHVSVVDWPTGEKHEVSAARCAAGWAIGGNMLPPKTVIIDGFSCRTYKVQKFGGYWIASLTR